jgi:hypothetical protein
LFLIIVGQKFSLADGFFSLSDGKNQQQPIDLLIRRHSATIHPFN